METKYPPRDEDGDVLVWLVLPDREDPGTTYQVLTTIPTEEYDHAMANLEFIGGPELH